VRFRATVLQNGKTATGFEVPASVVDELGSGRKPAVTVTIGAHTYRSTVATMSGRFMLPLSADNRAKAGVAAGDEIDVTIELDTEKRVLEVPADFATALDAEPAARANFDKLSFSHQRAHVDPIVAAKKDETRRRRIAKSVAMLAEGRAR
jgi:Bacteriocin-protection, YdeI or OmpD-Associated/Domain of unknown function (DUF1905)